MRTQFSIVRAGSACPLFAKLAALALALALTLSCSSDDDNSGGSGSTSSPSGGGSSSPSGGGGVPFNENSQIYDYKTSTNYIGSGVIEVVKGHSCSDNTCKWAAGSVTNGIVNLQLPPTIPSEYVKDFSWASEGCSGYEGIKVFQPSFLRLTDSDGYFELSAGYQDEQVTEEIEYWYLSKAGNITCKNEKSNRTMTINATMGWNKIYRVTDRATQKQEYNTNNILIKAVKWEISSLD